jgi:hypothetical protein
MNDEPIEILYQPAAHSDADSFVFFRKSDVVAAGDILDTTRFPVIDIAKGVSVTMCHPSTAGIQQIDWFAIYFLRTNPMEFSGVRHQSQASA